MINKRLLKNARLDYSNVSQNESYTFSRDHLLSIYSLDAVYTFIPKNACSSLRYSVGICNGYLKDIGDYHWIGLNNETFTATQREVALANYTFVILRCPYTRIASCFLDKVVDKKIEFHDEEGNIISLNFNEFLTYIRSQDRSEMNAHWRNQSDFLHYERYDDYFSLELFSQAIDTLSDHGFKVHDTRSEAKHYISSLNSIDGAFSKIKSDEIVKMKDEGKVPNYKSMYSNDEIKLVNDIYKDDINLYKNHFGKDNLLF